jgi:hypothetical protein
VPTSTDNFYAYVQSDDSRLVVSSTAITAKIFGMLGDQDWATRESTLRTLQGLMQQGEYWLCPGHFFT